MDAIIINDDHFTGFDFANELRMNQVESASLRSQHKCVFQLAKNQRPKAERIPNADDLLFTKEHKCESTVNLTQCCKDIFLVSRAGEQVQNDFAIDSSLENRSPRFQLFSENSSVYQITVVSDRQLSSGAVDHDRLRVFQIAGSSRGLWNVTDGSVSFHS